MTSADDPYARLSPLEDPARIFDLRGRVGVITGGGGQMGRRFAGVLARAGADLILADRAVETLAPFAADLAAETGRRVATHACDVADPEACGALFARVDAEHDRLDFFIHNVMAKPEGYYRPFEDYPPATWRAVMDANLGGAFWCAQAAAKRMGAPTASGGAIVLTASIYGVHGPDQRLYQYCATAANPYGGADPLNLPGSYCASKAGVLGLNRYLATLLAPRGIRVNCLVPGGVYDGQEAAFHDAYRARTPLGRMATWDEYNGAILFLVSDASRYMTGSTLTLDGGWGAW